MSRKHAAQPDPDWLTISKAIARRLAELREAGQTPVAIVLGPDITPVFRKLGTNGWASGRPGMFGLPVEADTWAEGWTIRVR